MRGNETELPESSNEIETVESTKHKQKQQIKTINQKESQT